MVRLHANRASKIGWEEIEQLLNRRLWQSRNKYSGKKAEIKIKKKKMDCHVKIKPFSVICMDLFPAKNIFIFREIRQYGKCRK